MSFIETKASVRYEVIDGKTVPIITPQCEVTLTNTKTNKEYNSDAEALADVQNEGTETKPEHVSRSVKVYVADLPLGTKTNL